MKRVRIIPVMTFGSVVSTRPIRHLYCDQSLARKMLQWIEAKRMPVRAGKSRQDKNKERDRTPVGVIDDNSPQID
jgi:hypothetical protein